MQEQEFRILELAITLGQAQVISGGIRCMHSGRNDIPGRGELARGRKSPLIARHTMSGLTTVGRGARPVPICGGVAPALRLSTILLASALLPTVFYRSSSTY